MTTISFDLPDDVFPALRRSPDEVTRDVRLVAAMYWYGRGEISQGKAASIAGLSRAEFLAALARAHQDVFVVDFDDLEHELRRG